MFVRTEYLALIVDVDKEKGIISTIEAFKGGKYNFHKHEDERTLESQSLKGKLKDYVNKDYELTLLSY